MPLEKQRKKRKGAPFRCKECGDKITFTRPHDAKKHILRDHGQGTIIDCNGQETEVLAAVKPTSNPSPTEPPAKNIFASTSIIEKQREERGLAALNPPVQTAVTLPLVPQAAETEPQPIENRKHKLVLKKPGNWLSKPVNGVQQAPIETPKKKSRLKLRVWE